MPVLLMTVTGVASMVQPVGVVPTLVSKPMFCKSGSLSLAFTVKVSATVSPPLSLPVTVIVAVPWPVEE